MGKGRVKRKEVETEDGWTVITHGLSGLSLDKGQKEKRKENGQLAGSMPMKTVEGLTAEKLLEDFKKLQERWEGTSVEKQIEDIIRDREWNVKEAVCIGIGSFSRDWEHRWRSLWQLVLFMDVIARVRKTSTISIYAQDPAFTPLDTTFLSFLSITPLTSTIDTHINAQSFVYSPFVDWYLLLPTFLQHKDPALYVGNEILDDYSAYAQTEEKREKLGECNELGRRFLERRKVVKVKEFEMHAHALNGMVVCWKKAEEEEDVISEETPG